MARKLSRRACPLARFHGARAAGPHKHDRGHMALDGRPVCYNCARRYRRICARARACRARAEQFRVAINELQWRSVFGDVAQSRQPTLLDLWEANTV